MRQSSSSLSLSLLREPIAVHMQVQQLQGDWAMVAVLDFIRTFRLAAGLHMRDFAASDLERALVVSPGGAGLLADVHMVWLSLPHLLCFMCQTVPSC